MMPPNKVGKHAKKYGELIKFCVGTYKAFADDVRAGGYPEESMAYPMDEAEPTIQEQSRALSEIRYKSCLVEKGWR